MDKATFRQQRRELIKLVKEIERKHAAALVRQNLVAAERPSQPIGVDPETNEWSNYLYDHYEWKAKLDVAAARVSKTGKSILAAQKRLDEFRPKFERPEDAE